MRIIICSVYGTAYEYKEELKDYNYEHIKTDYASDYDLSNLSKNDYTDYITINNLNDIFEISNKINKKIIIHNSNSGLYDEPYLEIYDDYRE